MKSRLVKVPSHRAFDIQSPARFESDVSLEESVELTPKLLASHIVLPHSSVEREELKEAYRTCFEALANIAPFNAIVSTRASFGGDKCGSRDWAQIYYEGRTVASFTHTQDTEHRPFEMFTEWPELKADEVETWTHDRWRGFFFSRITHTAAAARDVAGRLLKEAQGEFDFRGKVLSTLMHAA